MKPVRRLREPFVEVLCTEGSTKKAPWSVHEASSKDPWRNFVGLLHDDACNRVGSILCFVSPKLLTALRNPFKCHEMFLSLHPLFPPKRFDPPPPFGWMLIVIFIGFRCVQMFSLKSRCGYISKVLL